jgi:hypothetical protein
MAGQNTVLRLFSRLAHGSLLVSAAGLLATLAFGIGRLPLRYLAEIILVWILLGLLGIWGRIAVGCFRALDATLKHIEITARRR